jgi:hypothetical protein
LEIKLLYKIKELLDAGTPAGADVQSDVPEPREEQMETDAVSTELEKTDAVSTELTKSEEDLAKLPEPEVDKRSKNCLKILPPGGAHL